MNKIKQIARIFVYLLPVATLFGGYLYLPGLPDINLLRIVVVLLMVCGIAYWVARRGIKFPFNYTAPYAAVFIFMILYAAISLLWVNNRVASQNTLYYQAVGVCTALFIACALKTRAQLLRFFDVLTICYLIVVCAGVYEIFTGHFLFNPSNPELSLKNSYALWFPYAAFNNTNDYSTYVTLFFPFVAYDLVERLRGPLGKIAAFVIFAAAIFTLLNASPRVLYIAIGVMTVLFFISAVTKKNTRRYARGLLGIAIAGIAAIAVLAGTMLIKASVFADEIASINMADHSVSERSMLYLATIKMFFASHLLGVGVGNATTLMSYFSASIKPMNPHNMTLQLLAEYGVLVFIPYILALLFMAVRFFCYQSRDWKYDVLSCIGFALVCCFPIVGVSSADMTHILAVWPALGIFFACINVLYLHLKAGQAEDNIRGHIEEKKI